MKSEVDTVMSVCFIERKTKHIGWLNKVITCKYTEKINSILSGIFICIYAWLIQLQGNVVLHVISSPSVISETEEIDSVCDGGK